MNHDEMLKTNPLTKNTQMKIQRIFVNVGILTLPGRWLVASMKFFIGGIPKDNTQLEASWWDHG